jgi:tetratricopeptide (TPR) repeat protein
MSLARLGGDDLSRSFLSLVELGRSRISLKALSIVADRLELPMSYFLEGDMAPRGATAELLLDEAQASIERGEPSRALELLDVAELPESAKARAGNLRATALVASDRAREAVHVAEEALLLAQRQHDIPREAQLHYIIGAALYRMGAWDEAQVSLRRVIDQLTGENEDSALLAKATVSLGHILFVQGDVDGSISYYSRARDLFGVVTNLDSMATVYSGLSLAYEKKQDFSTALHYSKMSLAMYERRQNLLGAALELNNMAMRYIEMHDFESARASASTAAERARQAGSADIEALAHSTLAQIALDTEQLEEARTHAETAITLSPDDTSLARIDGWTVLADLAERAGDHDRVDELYGKAMEQLDHIGQHLRHADVAVAYSLALRRRGDTDRAFDLALRAAQMKSARSA